jgi:hypothetical protein
LPPASPSRSSGGISTWSGWQPGQERYDLVSAQYIHLPRQQRGTLFGALVVAVAPGGTLLIVGHHLSDLEPVPRPNVPGMYYTGDDVIASLERDDWDIVANSAAAELCRIRKGKM